MRQFFSPARTQPGLQFGSFGYSHWPASSLLLGRSPPYTSPPSRTRLPVSSTPPSACASHARSLRRRHHRPRATQRSIPGPLRPRAVLAQCHRSLHPPSHRRSHLRRGQRRIRRFVWRTGARTAHPRDARTSRYARLRRPSFTEAPRRRHRHAEARDHLRRRRVRLPLHARRISPSSTTRHSGRAISTPSRAIATTPSISGTAIPSHRCSSCPNTPKPKNSPPLSLSRTSRCSAGSPAKPIAAASGCCRASTTSISRTPSPAPTISPSPHQSHAARHRVHPLRHLRIHPPIPQRRPDDDAR